MKVLIHGDGGKCPDPGRCDDPGSEWTEQRGMPMTDMIVCHGNHEHAIFDSVSDHDDMYPRTQPNDCELYEAELIVSLGGHRGHYLGRDFAYEAYELLKDAGLSEDEYLTEDMPILDRYENEHAVEIEPGYTVAEVVQEMVETYENLLFENGFYVEWNDGVRIVKEGKEIGGWSPNVSPNSPWQQTKGVPNNE